jgi:small subunit ribosomal protein S20
LANHKSALKRARQNEIRRIRNKSYKTRVKKAVKEVRTAVGSGSVEQAGESFSRAISLIQKTASKGVIHKNKAARKISRLAHHVNQLAAPSGASPTQG